ncbi:MAG TPA: gamma-glutamyl-gamma-aminobutyrate hydrolase family protein [Candidatus Acidoferrales bacterium]
MAVDDKKTKEPRRILVLQHAASETLGTFEEGLNAAGLQPLYLKTFVGQAVPESSDDACGLIVMGGPMGVYETARYPFLSREMKLIDHFLRAEKPILGVCLGSQLLAACLGAKVGKGERKEIGWYPVRLTVRGARDALWKGQAPSFTAFHWHGDAFDLPSGAVSLASSDLTEVQAFRFGAHAYGFLFHLEVTEDQIRRMLGEFSREIEEEKLSPGTILNESRVFLPLLEKIGTNVFESWARLA